MNIFCVVMITLTILGNLFISYLGAHRIYDKIAEDSLGDLADWGIITMLTSVVAALPGMLVYSLIYGPRGNTDRRNYLETLEENQEDQDDSDRASVNLLR